MIRRRELIGLLGSAAAVWPLIARAQPRRMWRIGLLLVAGAEPLGPFIQQFAQPGDDPKPTSGSVLSRGSDSRMRLRLRTQQ